MFAWFSDLTPREKRTMTACFGGWSLDALDVQIFSFVIPSLLALWHISTGQAGVLGTITRAVQRSIHDAHGEDCTDAAEGDAMAAI